MILPATQTDANCCRDCWSFDGLTSFDLTSDNITRTPTGGVIEAGQGTASLANGSSMLLADAVFDFTTITNAFELDLQAKLDLSVSLAQPRSANSVINLDDVLQTPNLSAPLVVDGQVLETISHIEQAPHSQAYYQDLAITMLMDDLANKTL